MSGDSGGYLRCDYQWDFASYLHGNILRRIHLTRP